MGKYIAIIDERFAGISLKELQDSIGDFDVTAYPAHGRSVVLDINSKLREPEFYKRMDMKEPIFLDFYMISDSLLKGHSMVATLKALKAALKRSKASSFKLEGKLFNAELDKNAKAIEVDLGRKLEKLGYYADLADPEVIFYLVFLKDHTFIGHLRKEHVRTRVLDRFRLENGNVPDVVSRAEFKLKEAVEFFGIDLSKVGSAIDIGAAPGGWTSYLAKNGVKVLAIDNALLDYDKMPKGKVTYLKKEIRNERDLSQAKKFGKFDMLTMDANISPREAVKMVGYSSKLLKKDATLVMTAKLLTDSITEEIEAIKAKLSNNYRQIKMKRLPHNRREITVYARRK